MDLAIRLNLCSREEEHYDDMNPAVAGSKEPPVVPEENLKSEEEKKARRKYPTRGIKGDVVIKHLNTDTSQMGRCN